MDIKAMAKSKRSHTKHHQPRKPPSKTTPAPPSSSSSTSSNPKSQKREGRDRTKAAHSPSLPSNWDRYDDEGEEMEGLSVDSTSGKAACDFVKPKSKGANFGELIAQAKESRSTYSPSFLETVPDFYQGLDPMLSVRGESILAVKEGDDFLTDDEAATSHEAPFLSLDLQDLAEQLAKVDLAERLFIEADLLPPELRGQGAINSDMKNFQKSKRQNKTRVPETFDELFSLYLEEELNAEQEKKEVNDVEKITPAVICTSGSIPTSTPANLSESKLDDKDYPNAKDSKPSSRYEAVAAESELDMLLGSFSETCTFDSSASQSEAAITKDQHETLSSLNIPITSSLDDDLDNLLEETAKQDDKGGFPQSTEANSLSFDLPSTSSPGLNPTTKSKILEDFDSWFDTL